MGWLGSLTELMGRLPRLMILEAFAENPYDLLSAPDIVELTGVSRRSAYLIVRKLLNEGLLIRSQIPEGKNAIRYSLNPNDIRSRLLPRIEKLMTIGMLESELKDDFGLNQADPYPFGLFNQGMFRVPLKDIEIQDLFLAEANPTPTVPRVLPTSPRFVTGTQQPSQIGDASIMGSAT